MLFADDETSLQELMKIELPRLGHEATVCADGRAALAALEETSYDCVIVDLDMPHVGGLDVIRRVREVSPDTETVGASGSSPLIASSAAARASSRLDESWSISASSSRNAAAVIGMRPGGDAMRVLGGR